MPAEWHTEALAGDLVYVRVLGRVMRGMMGKIVAVPREKADAWIAGGYAEPVYESHRD